MTVHDAGDDLDKTYSYHADTGQWVNPLTGGVYDASSYATSAQAQAETAAEVKLRAAADAAALSTSAAAATNAASTNEKPGPKPDPTAAPKAPPPMTPDQIKAGLTNLNTDLDAIDKDLKDQNIYVTNKLQGDPVLVFQGIETTGNWIWDKTVGQLTGSQGLTCQGYVNKTMDKVKVAVQKQFPTARVDRVDFERLSDLNAEGIIGALKNKENHTFMKVTLPDGTHLAVDFHQHNASNFSQNPPIVRPYENVRNEWKKYLGADEFQENLNVNVNIKSKS